MYRVIYVPELHIIFDRTFFGFAQEDQHIHIQDEDARFTEISGLILSFRLCLRLERDVVCRGVCISISNS